MEENEPKMKKKIEKKRVGDNSLGGREPKDEEGSELRERKKTRKTEEAETNKRKRKEKGREGRRRGKKGFCILMRF